jgi:acyl-CoA thioesterase-2
MPDRLRPATSAYHPRPLDALAFYGLEHAGDGPVWRFPVVRELCSGLGALFGGCGLGAAIAALEHVTGRPLVWATAQFLEFARPPATVELEVTEVVRGRATSQARVLARVDGAEIFTVVGALGRRALAWSGEWAQRPEVPPPDACPPRPLRPDQAGTIAERMETRAARLRSPDQLDGTPGDGRAALWVRNPWGSDAQAAALAIVGDFVPMGIGQAGGRRAESNSLDNTLRMVRVHPTEWILADIRVHAVRDGFGHGLVHLWAQDGTLIATASQSTIVRDPRPGATRSSISEEP